jgi:Na+/H+-dicarboxylate symporter
MVGPLQFFEARSLKHLTEHLHILLKGRLWLKIIIGMVLGVIVGLLLGPSLNLVPRDKANIIANWLALPGNLFLVMIQMIVIPLVFASVILGIASNEDMSQLKRIGPRLVIYFLMTTVIAITLGVSFSLLIKPGKYIKGDVLADTMQQEVPVVSEDEITTPGLEAFPDLIISILPENPLSSMVGSEMLQIVIFSVIFGIALASLPIAQSKSLMDVLSALQEVCLKIVNWAMIIAPFAVFGLIARITTKTGLDVLLGMGVYIGTVLAALLAMLIVYMLIIRFISRKRPLDVLNKIRDVQLLAFSTSSSAAVMPFSIKTAEEKLNVRPSITQFIIPLGATINMDGTALYQGAAAVFLAQVFGVEFTLGSLILVIVTAVGASIGTPATPGVGIIILATVLQSAGIPTDGIALIIGVDRILDMSRTAINVTGDLTACTVMDRIVGTPPATEALPFEEKPHKVEP